MEAPDINMGRPAQVNQTANNSSPGDDGSIVREQNLLIPLAKVIEIMHKILPRETTVSEDSLEVMQQSLSKFISFITGEANDICHSEQRRKLTAEDVLRALNKVGFSHYIQPLTRYLQRYREYDGGFLEPSRGEPSRERVDSSFNHGMATFAPEFVPHYPGFASAPAQAPMSGYFNDASGAGTSQVAGANLEPFWPGPGAMGKGERHARGE